MPSIHGLILRILSLFILMTASLHSIAESGNGGSNAGSLRGTVTDPSGAVIAGATVHLTNQVSGLDQSATTDATGQFVFANIPFNPYQIIVTANGFAALSQSVEIRSIVGASLSLVLQVAGADSTVATWSRPTLHSTRM